jgi:hypothetical protein
MTTTALRTNRYPAACTRCGVTVPAEAGLLDKVNGSWVVTHPEACEAPAASTPAAPAPSADPVTEVGMYRDGTDVYKVQKSRQSGHLYAKRLTAITGHRLTEADEVVTWEFQYAPGAFRVLTAASRMTLDEAKAFGIRYGICCVCGASLKDAESVARGIGPVCGGRV